jgi:CheY-like chemotaxis protein
MKQFSGSAISRYQVFMLADGTYVDLWENDRVQELLTGQYRDYDHKHDFGHPITDYELAQLRASGRVGHFNRHYVWLLPLPEAGRFGQRRALGDASERLRAYYLITSYPKSELENVRVALETRLPDSNYSAQIRDDVVIIMGLEGSPFRTVEEVELAQSIIINRLSDVLGTLSVAFMELKNVALGQESSEENSSTGLDLDDIIASQTDTSNIAGKLVVLAVVQDDERDAFDKLFAEMKLEVKHASTASETQQMLEDYPADLLLMDIQLPDMHGFQLLGKLREIQELHDLPIMIITNQTNFATTVAKVDYLTRPVSIARLRHNIWVALNQNDS